MITWERIMEIMETASGYFGYFITGAIVLLSIIAAIRIAITAAKGKKVDTTPVGVFNDLPESITGIKKDK